MNFAGIPRGPAAALAALHLREPNLDDLARLTDSEWGEALDFTDRSGLTLPLGANRAREAMPQWVRERIDGCHARNLKRLERLEALYRALDACLNAAGIDYLALKGLAHCPDFGTLPGERVQYDIDLYTPKDRVTAAQSAVIKLGFEPLEAMDHFPTDHLPALIRKTGWEWRGDFFDPDLPIAVELHFRFWNQGLERLRAPDVGEFWPRRMRREVAGVEMGALRPVDALGFASLHLLKHVVQGSGRPFHLYEVARFLDLHVDDEGFWSEWRALHAPELRRLEAAMFCLAHEWFGCRLGVVPEEEIERLPASTDRWFQEFAASPVSRLFHPTKVELWLHLSLLDSPWDALAVTRRRLLPISLPGPVDAIHIPDSELTWRRRALKRIRYLRHTGQRIGHHARTLPGALWSGARWWWKPQALGGQFWNFLVAAVLFNFAMFIFVLLYNLRLMELGYREDFLGMLSSAGTIGCVAGTLPAAALYRRIGLRGTLLATFGGSACFTAMRAVATARMPLMILSFGNGLIFAAWAVVMAPAIAAAVEEKRRATAFSFFAAVMFATGIIGGWAGGRLPLLVQGKESALLLAAALSALALLPASRLRGQTPAPQKSKKMYPRTSFMLRYLIPFAIWNLATGGYNPFFNAYFARLGYGAERIGSAFSAAQLAQVVTVLFAPLVLRKAGLANGVALMIIATAAGLMCLALCPPGAAAAAYVGYMAFQWMSEPGLNTLLMDGVEEHERGGASALNYLVMFGSQALAALAGGALISRFGYGVALTGSALLAVLAAWLFRSLLGRTPLPKVSPSGIT